MAFGARVFLVLALALGVGCGRSIRHEGDADAAGSSGDGSGGTGTPTGGRGGASGSGGATKGGTSGSGAAAGETNERTQLFFESAGALLRTDFSGEAVVELWPPGDAGTSRYTLLGTEGPWIIVFRERFESSGLPTDAALLRVAADGSVLSTVYSGSNFRALSPVVDGRVVLVVPPEATTLEVPQPGGPERIAAPLTGLASVRTDGTGFEVLAASGVRTVNVVGDRVIYSYSDATVSELYTSLPDGAERKALVPSPGNKSVNQVSGTRLVVSVNGDVVSVDPDGSRLVELATTPDVEYAAGIAGEHVVILRHVTSNATGQTDLYAVPIGGGALVPLATGPEPEDFAGASGDRVVYHVDYSDVYSVRLDGSDRLPIATTADREYVFGVEGDRVLFTRSENLSGSPLLSATLEGTGLVTLAENIGELAAIVDDRAVVIMGGARDVFSIPVAGGSALGLAENAEPDFVVGRLGRTLILMRGGGTEDGELSRIQADGSERTLLLQSGRYVGAITEGCGVVSSDTHAPCKDP